MVSTAVGCQPVFIDAGDICATARPRLYWLVSDVCLPWQGEVQETDGLLHVRIPGSAGPCSRWLEKGASFQGLINDEPPPSVRLPTLVRSLPSHKPPWKPRGISRCAPHELSRWRAGHFRYAPYQFKDKNCVLQADGFMRPPTSNEREVLLDFEPRHTITCLPTSARKQRPQELEDLRCSLLGNSFACAVVAWILAHWAQPAGLIANVPSIQTMRAKSSRGRQEEESAGRFVCKKALESAEARQHPSVRLVHHLLRSTDARGSDIRVDTDQMTRPGAWPRKPLDVTRWLWQTVVKCKWRQKAHITELECRAMLASLKWRLRQKVNLKTRFLHLADSQAGIGTFTKGRSSSRALNAVIKKADAFCLASLCRPAYGYTETDRNSADYYSRESGAGSTL